MEDWNWVKIFQTYQNPYIAHVTDGLIQVIAEARDAIEIAVDHFHRFLPKPGLLGG